MGILKPTTNNQQPTTVPCGSSYEHVLSVLNESHNRRIKPGLLRITSLLSAMGNPHRDFPAIHIAGTNGKGSVAAVLSAMLTSGGLKTGLYTSPHLQDYRERMRLNGNPITRRELVGIFKSLPAQAEGEISDNIPTPYELGTALAFTWFSRLGVDIAVVETGMGGRWDATNVLENVVVSIITNISYDHCDYLGNDLASIASEKAGIIKNGTPVLTGASGPAYEVISSAAAAAGSPIYACGREITWEHGSGDTAGAAQLTDVGFEDRLIKNLPQRLPGCHQEMNLALAVSAACLLPDRFRPDEETMRKGLSSADWPGRLELFPGTPSFLLDGAHNPDGMEALCTYLDTLSNRYPRLVAVTGILADKDATTMIGRLSQSVSASYFISPASDRSLTASDMADMWPRSGEAEACKDLPEAMRLAAADAGKDGLVCVAGSLYLAGEARTLLGGGERCRYYP
ncbi:MAG: bifunctional folylpolyglutamate synthase/dihydrofolate synthase [bacterium]|nr:bifunctional folylpolyglutamate synthase/dihydrofolate synthase [bacterium]